MVESSPEKSGRPWYSWVDEQRRGNLLSILVELTRLQERDPQFILIGALSLLIRGILHYMVLWDLDLLFRNEKALHDFVDTEKSPGLRIIHYDEDLMRGRDITSLHTAWSFDRTWFNVDYILKSKMFDFYYSTVRKDGPYEGHAEHGGKAFRFTLFMAHPWDVFIEKILSPRFHRELEAKDTMSVDIRHAVRIFEYEKDNQEFWKTLAGRVARLNKRDAFRRNLLRLLSSLPELGFGSVNVDTHVIQRISDM